MEDRTTTNTVNSNAINEISLSSDLPSANSSSEKTQGVGLYDRIAKPTNVHSNFAGLAHWQECYGALWELKIAFQKQHNS
jgi:hypothetical protein